MPTVNFAWVTPTVAGDNNAWGQKLNDLFAAIDTDLKAVKTTADAALPKIITTNVDLNNHSLARVDSISPLGRVERLALDTALVGSTITLNVNLSDTFADSLNNAANLIVDFTNVAPAADTYREIKFFIQFSNIGLNQSLSYKINSGTTVPLVANFAGPKRYLVTLATVNVVAGGSPVGVLNRVWAQELL